MLTMNRRRWLQWSSGGLAAAALSPTEAAKLQAVAKDADVARGYPLTAPADANPLQAKVAAFTVVTPDLATSSGFYRDTMGYHILSQGVVTGTAGSAPGLGTSARRYVLMAVPGAKRGATLRILEALPGADANRPRPGARAWDPGLAVMEAGMRDPAESYRALANASTPMISPPRYYFFRANGSMPDLDVMSYAPFGPGGEQMFLTANIRNDRPDWPEPGLHSTPSNVVIVTLDQRPADAFYANAFGLRRINQMDCQQRNCNELIGAPRDLYFLWGNIGGSGFNMEIWEVRVAEGRVYPTSLDRTGLAMFTVQVKDLDRCRGMCVQAGIKPVGSGSLPLPGNEKPGGFTLRGAVGELVEVVQG
jgi:catechol 2,3-dioxygenase-like lactoylglutathione lyase family enzyme